jgi:hypothetical protein
MIVSEEIEVKPNRTLAIAALIIGLAGVGAGVGALVKLDGLAENEALGVDLVERLGNDDDLIRTIANSSQISEATRANLDAALGEPETLDNLIAQTLVSDGLNQLVTAKGTAAMDEFKESAAFREAVRAATIDAESDSDPITEMNRSLTRYEKQLSALAQRVEDDESAGLVNALQGQLVGLQKDIAGLSDRVACAVAYRGNSPRTFLLKSNESTDLPGMDLVVSLSRVKNDVIETVSVSARDGALNQVHTQVIGQVSLGKPFTINQGDTHYEGTFTFAQTRLFGKAFIGFEIRMTDVAGEPCSPEAPETSTEMISAAG